jgi:exonuclease SbcC
MIPIKLTLKGFLSYRALVEIDFSNLEVACISGANGAGKSSLFDAITWALFGKARRSDDALINDSANLCSVAFEFWYESDRYRIERIKERDKNTRLEFQIWADDSGWNPLTEAGSRSTEERIRAVLHMDYDTFINSSFFLQGKADLFAQQAPARRKEILGSILGLEIWESYREETLRRRRSQESELKLLQQHLDEIFTELGLEKDRQEKLALLSDSLAKTSALRQEKENNWNQVQSEFQKIRLEKEKLQLVSSQLETARKRMEAAQKQAAERRDELDQYERVLDQAEEIRKSYQGWQALRSDVEKWNTLADQFHGLQSRRADFNTRIQTEQARLMQEREHLLAVKQDMGKLMNDLPSLQADLEADQKRIIGLEKQIGNLPPLEQELADLQTFRSELLAENIHLKERMQEIKQNIEILGAATGTQCPLCGQPLDEAHRAAVQNQFQDEGKTLGDRYRENKQKIQTNEEKQDKLKERLNGLHESQTELTGLQRSFGQKDQKVSGYKEILEKWQRQDEPRLQEVEAVLANNSFCGEVRVQLQQVDESVNALGYQPEIHEHLRKREQDERVIEEGYRTLEKAQTAVETLRREIAALQGTQAGLETEMKNASDLQSALQESLASMQTNLPDLPVLEKDLDTLRGEENQYRLQVGAAQQMVDVLDKQRQRQADINAQMDTIKHKLANLKTLETAFGKDGIQALLIEQALPEIESQANEILDRLSSGNMSVFFKTERKFKDKKREDKMQTLDIFIGDSLSGKEREYELFSGGEAFRINFAIRLALSRVLAQRAGARLQTLVIDEGFGSQDAEGRQRLIEAINMVSRDFAKILVITHLDELKDAFPSRIEVQKTQDGSRVEVIP